MYLVPLTGGVRIGLRAVPERQVNAAASLTLWGRADDASQSGEFLITGFVGILFGGSMSVAGLGPMAMTVGLFGVAFSSG